MSNNDIPENIIPKDVGKRTYALLQETSGEECESWYYFIKYEGNEENIAHLEKQLEDVDWYTLDDLSTFVIETKYLVSEETAKEMTKIDINHKSFHRKFDGTLKRIDLGFKKHDKTEKKMIKAFKILGYGQIEDYIDQEDVDPNDLVTQSESETESCESSEDESSSESEESVTRKKRHGKLPEALTSIPKQPIPRVAAIKQHNRRKK